MGLPGTKYIGITEHLAGRFGRSVVRHWNNANSVPRDDLRTWQHVDNMAHSLRKSGLSPSKSYAVAKAARAFQMSVRGSKVQSGQNSVRQSQARYGGR